MRALFSALTALSLLALSALAAAAAPTSYRLDPDQSKVEFTYSLSGKDGTGTMPITRADLDLDFDAVANSTAKVTLDASGARTNYFFVTDALKGDLVLDTAQYPAISFVSRKVSPAPGGATIQGDVTIRGVTRPMVLSAQIYRRDGSAAGDRSRLSVRLTGQIDRTDFGADGYADMVGPVVKLDILARLESRN